MSEWRKVGALAAPITLAEIVGVAVPQVVVGLMSAMGAEALYVRSLFAPVLFVFLAVQAGVGVSAQVAAARLAGGPPGGQEGRETGPVAGPWGIAVSMARVGVAASAVAAVALALAAPLLADALSVRPSVRGDFEWFVRWVCLASLASVGPVVCSSVLRGAGRARASVLVLLGSATAEVAGVAVLGLPGAVGWGMWSVPCAVAGSGLLGTAVGLAVMRRAGLTPGRSRRGTRPPRPEVRGLVTQVGGPVAASFLVIFVSSSVMTWVASGYGSTVVSGFAVAYTMQTMVIVPGIAIGSATAITVNHYRGQGREDRAEPVVRAGLGLAAVVYVVLAAGCWLGRDSLAGLVTGDPAVAHQAERYLGLVAPTYLVMGVVLAALTALEQIGGGPLAATLNVVYFAGTCAVGAVWARQAGQIVDLYRTVAVANILGVAVVPVALGFVRRARAASTAAAPPPGAEPATGFRAAEPAAPSPAAAGPAAAPPRRAEDGSAVAPAPEPLLHAEGVRPGRAATAFRSEGDD
ncbi:MATE family efflux transporter [Actinacidiphila yeochonensis]|uniref:MATE family efflux transporter n=1 Tax=Actinacidiphila yeochonensis TaxID=89050 RepID=UPI000690E73D|nr:MATE family efflux transporter [Actinacidiphila yeochonensis]